MTSIVQGINESINFNYHHAFFDKNNVGRLISKKLAQFIHANPIVEKQILAGKKIWKLVTDKEKLEFYNNLNWFLQVWVILVTSLCKPNLTTVWPDNRFYKIMSKTYFLLV